MLREPGSAAASLFSTADSARRAARAGGAGRGSARSHGGQRAAATRRDTATATTRRLPGDNRRARTGRPEPRHRRYRRAEIRADRRARGTDRCLLSGTDTAPRPTESTAAQPLPCRGQALSLTHTHTVSRTHGQPPRSHRHSTGTAEHGQADAHRHRGRRTERTRSHCRWHTETAHTAARRHADTVTDT